MIIKIIVIAHYITCILFQQEIQITIWMENNDPFFICYSVAKLPIKSKIFLFRSRLSNISLFIQTNISNRKMKLTITSLPLFKQKKNRYSLSAMKRKLLCSYQNKNNGENGERKFHRAISKDREEVLKSNFVFCFNLHSLSRNSNSIHFCFRGKKKH